MNELVEREKTLTLDSREVAEMVDKNHADLLRDIRKYEDYLGKSNFALAEFFIQSNYIDAQGKERICYQITKKGCEFIAHKLTGQKGAIFTATYINKFHEMEKALKEQPPKIDSKFLYLLAEQLEEKEKKIAEQKREIEHKTEVIKGVTDDIDIYTKRNVLNKVVRYKGANFAERWNELYDRFREVYSIDLKARCEGYNLKQQKKKDELSVIKYAEQFGYLDKLYKIALKLYETDINEILKHLQKIA
jgi:Rha family phage regulatory protein